MARSIGVIGVGNTGIHFVEWLADAGHDVIAYDIDPERVAAAAERGADPGEHPADVTARSEVVVLALPGSQYVEAVMEGGDGVLDELEAGQLVVDTGTTRPDTDIHYARVCADRDAGFVDSPMTWGGPGEEPTMFVGGSDEDYADARPIVERLSHGHEHLGGVGAGQVAKAGHRLRQNNRAMVDAEVVEFWRDNGVDPEAMDGLLELGLHERFFAEGYPSVAGWEAALSDERPDVESIDGALGVEEMGARPRLRESHWAKDQAYGVEIGHAGNTALPISSAVYQAMLAAQNYAEALFDREIGFQDPDWYDRADPIAHFRRLNRPAEEWRRVNREAE